MKKEQNIENSTEQALTIPVVSKSNIERHCMKLWAKTECNWEHYLAAKEYEKILAKKHCC
jgi:hypothetical protein